MSQLVHHRPPTPLQKWARSRNAAKWRLMGARGLGNLQHSGELTDLEQTRLGDFLKLLDWILTDWDLGTTISRANFLRRTKHGKT